jgi:thiol-disulfide isomerase/thioredoxin
MAMSIRRAGLFALLVCFTQFAFAAPPVPHLGQGDIPPSFLGRDANDKDVNVEDMRGKVTVVSFWATWCGYCQKELPILASIQKLAGGTQLQVIAVNTNDDYDKFRIVRRRLKKYDLVLTYDSGAISKAYGVTGLPHLVMIGRDGRIAYVHEGYDESMLDTIASELNTLLAAPVPAPTHAP